MSYLSGTQTSKKIQMTTLTWDSTAVLNSYCDFTIADQFPSSFITNLSSSDTEINLPAGHYMGQAFIDYTRSSISEQIQFKWELDGTLLDHFGSSDISTTGSGYGATSDNAETVFTLYTTGVLKMKIIVREGSGTFTVNTANSYVLLTRTEL